MREQRIRIQKGGRTMDYKVMVLPVKAAKEYHSGKITYSSLFWLFVLGSVAGFVLEGIWCILRLGVWESHSSTVWGPFCIIYGFGVIAVYLLSMTLKGKSPVLQFLLFSGAGTIVEYFGSLFQNVVFGSTSWDYSSHFMNIRGRVSLQMTLIWGVLGILFMRFVFPMAAQFLRKMEEGFWKTVCPVLFTLMIINLLLSAAAVMRWKERLTDNIPATNTFEQFLDENYNDGTMEKRYPNMRFHG